MLTQNFLGSGYSLEEAQTLAYKMMEGALFKQQSLVSYDMGFLMVGFVILICIPVVLMIRYKKGEKAKVINDH
jgi:DHA2 family multidrug resistance protein